MNTFNIGKHAARREFLKRATLLSGLGAAAPLALNLAAMGSAAAADPPSDYKAIVCLFMFGGNDHYNMVLPYDQTSYDVYSGIRNVGVQPIVLPRNTLLPIGLPMPSSAQGGRRFALAPQLPNMASLFGSGQAAVMANVGPLVAPTTLAQFTNLSVPLPPKLFSHNDQQSVWQSLSPEGASSGWGGRMGDLFASSNAQPVFTCISAAGNTVFLAGKNVAQYQVSTAATVSVAINGLDSSSQLYGSTANSAALRSLITDPSAHLLESDYANIVKRSITANGSLQSALAATPAPATVFAASSLSQQLKTVARLISLRNQLGVKRQVYFVSLGGFDTHDDEPTRQAPLLADVDTSVADFYKATIEMGLQNQVTLFTASDFGRTLTSNGDGTDHGWGSYHFVVGGAVKGGDIYGSMPDMGLRTSTDTGNGRLLPSMAVDQFAATLASWFGVEQARLKDVLPNLANFSSQNIGFMKA